MLGLATSHHSVDCFEWAVNSVNFVKRCLLPQVFIHLKENGLADAVAYNAIMTACSNANEWMQVTLPFPKKNAARFDKF